MALPESSAYEVVEDSGNDLSFRFGNDKLPIVCQQMDGGRRDNRSTSAQRYSTTHGRAAALTGLGTVVERASKASAEPVSTNPQTLGATGKEIMPNACNAVRSRSAVQQRCPARPITQRFDVARHRANRRRARQRTSRAAQRGTARSPWCAPANAFACR